MVPGGPVALLAPSWLAFGLVIAAHLYGCVDDSDSSGIPDVAIDDSRDLAEADVPGTSCRRRVAVAVNGPASTGRVTFVIPEAATSFLLTARWGQDGALAFDSLVSPLGVERLAPGWSASPFGATCLSCPNRTTFAPHSVSLLVPVRPGIAVEAGSWDAAVVHVKQAARAESELTWSASAVVAEDLLTTLRLPLEVVARDGATLAAFREGGGEAPVVAAFKAAGIDVEFEWTTDLAAPATVDALALGAIERGSRGISVLMVDVLTGTDDVTLAGASPLPGPVRDGAVVLARQAPSLGRTLAHELGHYLGLYHLTEPGAADIHDPLPDTALADEDNLMHVFGDGLELTAQQIAVLRGHPVLMAPECD